MTYLEFFSNLGFDFNVDLRPKAIDIEKEATLSQKLKNSVFFYKSQNKTNTSFNLVTSSLETIARISCGGTTKNVKNGTTNIVTNFFIIYYISILFFVSSQIYFIL